MPIYEYQCADCGETFEKFYFTASCEDTKITCEKCNSTNVVKMISLFGSSEKSTGGGCAPQGGFT